MLRPSRKRTRNKISVRKAPFGKTTEPSSSPSATGAKTDVQPSSSPASGTDTVPERSLVAEGDSPGKKASFRVSQSTSSSPKRFKSKSTISNRSLSPARFYREREQSELQTLNDRLSSHLETVKKLQCENASLRLHVEGLEIIRLEKDTRKHFHQSDITTLQDMLDTTRQENKSLEQTLKVIRKERDSLRQSLGEKEEDVSLLEIRIENMKSVSQQYSKMESELKTLKETLKEKEADANRLSDNLVKEKMAKKRLEEEAQINKSRYIKEMEEASIRMNRHLETADQKLEAGYEVLVSDALVSVREQNSRDLTALRDELTTVYQTKLSDWKSKAERSNADLLSTRKELKISRTEVDTLRAQTTRLKMDIAALKVQIEEDQSKYTGLKNESEKDACHLQRDMIILKQELAEVKDELEEMGGVNMRLEREIATYRVLLDDLESKSPFTKKANEDRRKHDFESSSAGQKKLAESECRNPEDIHLRTNEMDKGVGFDTVDVDGRFLSVINRADHLVDLCLWTVTQSISNKQIKFEIPYTTPVTSDQRLYIWGDGEGPFKDKPGCDQILSRPDDPETRDFYGIRAADTASHMMTGRDAIHISLHGKRWLRRPQFMNLRLDDGDGQLQAKCDITVINNKNRMELEMNAATHDRKQTRKVSSSRGGTGQPDVELGGVGDKTATSLTQDCKARTTPRVAGGFDPNQELTKDGCIVM